MTQKPEADTVGASAREGGKPRAGGHLFDALKSVALGLAVGAALLLVRLPFEHHAKVEGSRLWCYRTIQRWLSVLPTSRALSVAVVDISGVRAISEKDDPRVAPGLPVTDRAALLEYCRVAAAGGAKAIGIDIDFSYENGSPVWAEDPACFEKILALADGPRKVPVFLGVYRCAAETPDRWLGSRRYAKLAAGLPVGSPSYQQLAADVRVPVGDVLRMFTWTRVEGSAAQTSPERLPSLSASLAAASQAPHYEWPGICRWMVELRREVSLDRAVDTEGFLVDYSQLADIRATAIVGDRAREAAAAGRFRNRAVLLGALRSGDDSFGVPGHGGRHAGVLLHACATQSLLTAPLWEFTPPGRAAMDLGLALVMVVLACAIRFRRAPQVGSSEGQGSSWTASFVLAGSAFALGLIIVHATRVMWDDFVLAFAGLVLHVPAEKGLHALYHWLRCLCHQKEAAADVSAT